MGSVLLLFRRGLTMLSPAIGALIGLSLFCCAQFAQASVTLNTTRVVFEGKHKEASLEAQNRGKSEILVQAWLDAGDGAAADTGALPFAVTPPLSKVAAQGRQSLRILYQGGGMPIDRESVLWLNVQEIPQASTKENVLQLAIRQRIKMFYRPTGLPGTANEAPVLIEWQLHTTPQGQVLRANNTSKYHVSLAELELTSTDYSSVMDGTTMIAPGERRDIPVKPTKPGAAPTLRFKSINDYGGQNAYQAQLSHTSAVAAVVAKGPDA